MHTLLLSCSTIVASHSTRGICATALDFRVLTTICTVTTVVFKFPPLRDSSSLQLSKAGTSNIGILPALLNAAVRALVLLLFHLEIELQSDRVTT